MENLDDGAAILAIDETSFLKKGEESVQSLVFNISINPGLLVVMNPEGDNDNDTIYVGTIRTVFKF